MEFLEFLSLPSNPDLTGRLPQELRKLTNLRILSVEETGLTGPIPTVLQNLPLTNLAISDTDLCVPRSTAFRTWLEGVIDPSDSTLPPTCSSGGGSGAGSVTVPDPPTNLVAEGGDGQVVLTWEAPASTDGAEILRYEYRYSMEPPVGEAPAWTDWIPVGTGLTVTVTGLTGDTPYTFEVRAVTSAGAGQGGTATVAVRLDVTDALEPPLAPGPPQVRGVRDSQTALQVTWRAPANTGPPITHYALQYRPGMADSWTDGSQMPAGHEARLEGLRPETVYEVRVRAVNADGAGAWSGPGRGRTGQKDARAVRAWLARFGRTVATHVTDTVGERLRAAPGQGSYLTVGGYRLPLGQHGGPDAEDEDRLTALLKGLAGMVLGSGATRPAPGETGMALSDADPRLGRSQTLQPLRLRELLKGSAFRLTLGADEAGAAGLRLTVWGRVAGTTFDGREGPRSLDGDVLTGTVGVDREWARGLAGVAVAHSRGDGAFTGTGPGSRGTLEQTLTSLHPYLHYAVTDRLDVWGVLGYGWGESTLEQGASGPMATDTTWLMGAVGGRGILLEAAEAGGFELATRTDAMFMRMTSDEVATAAGNLAATDADTHRLRVVLEGSRPVTWPEGQRLTPTVELGLRHDWGDAETGFGLELGGRVRYADPAWGLTIDGAVRGLLAHEDSAYKEWGASGTIRIDPGPMGQGLALTLSPTWGVASSGVENLWSRQTTAGLAPQGNRTHGPGRPAERAGRVWAVAAVGRGAGDAVYRGDRRRPGRLAVTRRPRVRPSGHVGDRPARGTGGRAHRHRRRPTGTHHRPAAPIPVWQQREGTPG